MASPALAHHVQALRGPPPADKSVGDALAGSSAAEELSEGDSGKAIRRDRGEEREHGQALAHVDVRNLLREAKMPANGCPFVLLGRVLCEEER